MEKRPVPEVEHETRLREIKAVLFEKARIEANNEVKLASEAKILLDHEHEKLLRLKKDWEEQGKRLAQESKELKAKSQALATSTREKVMVKANECAAQVALIDDLWRSKGGMPQNSGDPKQYPLQRLPDWMTNDQSEQEWSFVLDGQQDISHKVSSKRHRTDPTAEKQADANAQESIEHGHADRQIDAGGSKRKRPRNESADSEKEAGALQGHGDHEESDEDSSYEDDEDSQPCTDASDTNAEECEDIPARRPSVDSDEDVQDEVGNEEASEPVKMTMVREDVLDEFVCSHNGGFLVMRCGNRGCNTKNGLPRLFTTDPFTTGAFLGHMNRSSKHKADREYHQGVHIKLSTAAAKKRYGVYVTGATEDWVTKHNDALKRL